MPDNGGSSNMMNGGGVLFTINGDGTPMFKSLEKVDLALLQTEKKAKTTSEKISAAFKGVGDAISGISRNYMNIRFAILDAVGGMKGFIDKAMEMRGAMMGLSVIAGKEFGTVKEAVARLAADGQVSIAALSNSMKNLISRGFSAEQAEKMLAATKAMATFNRQAGLNMDEAVQRFTEGLKNEMSTLTDSAGATKNLSNVWADYAKSIGKGVASLTQAEKVTAEYNWTMDEGTKFLGKYNEALGGAEGAMGKANAEFNRLQGVLGERLLPAFVGILRAATGFLDFLLKLPAPLQVLVACLPLIGAGVMLLVPAISGLIPIIGSLIAGTATLGVTIGAATAGISVLAAILIPLGINMATLAARTAAADKRIDEFGTRLKNTKNLKEYRDALAEIGTEYQKLDDAAKQSIIRQLENRARLIELSQSNIVEAVGADKIRAYRDRLAKGTDLKTGAGTSTVTSSGGDLASAMQLGTDLKNINDKTVAGVKNGNANAAFQNVVLTNEEIKALAKLIELERQAADVEGILASVRRDGNKATGAANDGSKKGAEIAVKLSSELVKLNSDFDDLMKTMQKIKDMPMTNLGKELIDELLKKFSGISGAVLSLMDGFIKWNQATADLTKNQNRLEAAILKAKAAKQAFEADPKNAELEGAWNTAKKSVEEYGKEVEKTKEAVNSATAAQANGILAVAAAVFNGLADWVNAADEILAKGGSTADAVEGAWKNTITGIVAEIPIIGKLYALMISKIWETEAEKREAAVARINGAVELYERQISLGQHQFIEEQITFYEAQLSQLRRAGASEEEIYNVEVKLYNLKQKQIDAQKELNREIEQQKKSLEDMKKGEAEKQLDNLAREFEILVKNGSMNMGVTEDRNRAISFYTAIANKAASMGLNDTALSYREKVAELQGGMSSSRSYGATSYSAATSSAVDALTGQVGAVSSSVDQALTNNTDFTDAEAALALTEEIQRLSGYAANIKASYYDAFNENTRYFIDEYTAAVAVTSAPGAGIHALADKNWATEVMTRVKNAMTGMVEWVNFAFPASALDTLMPNVKGPDGLNQRQPNMNAWNAITFNDSTWGRQIQEYRDTLRTHGADPAKITFHDGGIVGGSSSFADLFGGLRPDETVARLQLGELVVPRSATAALMSGKSGGTLSISIGNMVFNGANDPERNARETLREIEKIANRNGYTVMGGK